MVLHCNTLYTWLLPTQGLILGGCWAATELCGNVEGLRCQELASTVVKSAVFFHSQNNRALQWEANILYEKKNTTRMNTLLAYLSICFSQQKCSLQWF